MNPTPVVLTPALLRWLNDHAGAIVNVTINKDLTVSFREPGFRTGP